mgnify:CR=1 FL=1
MVSNHLLGGSSGEWGRGVAAALKWKTANKYRTDADEFQLLWKQLGAVGRASDLEPDLDLS